MHFLRQQPSILFWGIATVCTLLLVLGACNSPRRFVIGSPGGPTPSPTETPTPIVSPSASPTPIPTITPIPTATPFGMATPVPRKDAPAQFLFTISPDSQLMNGFRINGDGSLEPVPGSPFVTSTPMRFAVSVHGALIAASKDSLFAFAVDHETGAIRQTSAFQTGAISKLATDLPANMVLATTQAGPIAFLVSNGKLMAVPGEMTDSEIATAKAQPQPSAVLDASGKFMYVADAAKAELAAFQVENGKPLALSPPAYPVPRGTAAIALVKPEQ